MESSLGEALGVPGYERRRLGVRPQQLHEETGAPLEHNVAGEFIAAVVEEVRVRDLMSSEHFTVDGTLIEAMASLKASEPKVEDRHRH